MFIRYVVLVTFLCTWGCATHGVDDDEYWTSTVLRYNNTGVAKSFSEHVTKIEKGDLSAWERFAAEMKWIDGHASETYSAACSELLRRDPTFLLRRYLLGDSRALEPARRGYGWSGNKGRELLDEIYARRLYIASTDTERQKITKFIRETTNPYKEWRRLEDRREKFQAKRRAPLPLSSAVER